MDNNCPHCNALLFKGERNISTCCQHGETMPVPYAQPLPDIDELFKDYARKIPIMENSNYSNYPTMQGKLFKII